MPEAMQDNLPELTVSELSQSIRRTVEDAFGYVRVRGEVSGWRGPHNSGHCYFALKDENARIDAIIWRGTYQKLKIPPEEGMEVIAVGRVTTYPGRSTYQIVIERIEPAGVGALMALLEERRRKLAAEGLFAEPASAASVAGLRLLARTGVLERGAVVVCVLTGHGLKDPDTAARNAIPVTTAQPTVDGVRRALGW
jgi:exodeoxyribonuclease VII large subunit